MIVTLHLDPLCVKFIEHYYDKDKDGVFYSQRNNSLLYNLVASQLEVFDHPFNALLDKGRIAIKYRCYSENRSKKLDVRNKFSGISEQNMNLINFLIRDRFISECYAFVFGNVEQSRKLYNSKNEIKQNLNYFMNHFKLTDQEIKYDTLKKMLYRSKITAKTGLKCHKGLVMN